MTHIPEPLAYVADLMSDFRSTWFVCGGWAVDAWLGRHTREHGDVDISVFHDDQGDIFNHLPGWALVAHDPNVPDDTREPWNGRPLDLPAHIHVPTVSSTLATSTTAIHSTVEFEILLNERTERDCVLNPDPRVTIPLERCIQSSPWHQPTAAPEVVLFFKAGGNLAATEAGQSPFRPHDEQDFDALLPILTKDQRTWLRDALAATRPDHHWLTRLN